MFHLFQATHIHQYNNRPIDLPIIVIDTMKHYRPTRWRPHLRVQIRNRLQELGGDRHQGIWRPCLRSRPVETVERWGSWGSHGRVMVI